MGKFKGVEKCSIFATSIGIIKDILYDPLNIKNAKDKTASLRSSTSFFYLYLHKLSAINELLLPCYFLKQYKKHFCLIFIIAEFTR